MTCYQAMVSDLCEKMIGEQLPYKDTILLGDNSSGKSLRKESKVVQTKKQY